MNDEAIETVDFWTHGLISKDGVEVLFVKCAYCQWEVNPAPNRDEAIDAWIEHGAAEHGITRKPHTDFTMEFDL